MRHDRLTLFLRTMDMHAILSTSNDRTRRSKRHARSRRGWWALSTMMLAGLMPAQQPRPSEQSAPAKGAEPAATEVKDAAAPQQLDTVRAALEKWVETRNLISRERADWVVGRGVLAERLDMIKREIETVRGRIAETDKSIAANDKAKSDLTTRKMALEEASTALRETANGVEQRTLALLPRLPESLQERVRPYSQRIPLEPAKAEKTPLSERFASVVSVLNEVNKFNREVSVESEVRALPDGRSARVRVLYVGVGQAYYVTSTQDAAGVGSAGPNGWVWTAANDQAPAIARAIAMHQNEQPAAFVGLPLRIQ